MSERPPADRRQVLVPHVHVRYPAGVVVAHDRQRGVLIECVCGAQRWSTFGHARRHAERCPLVARSRAGSRPAIALALRAAGRRGATVRELAAATGLSRRHASRVLSHVERERVPRSSPPRWRSA